MHHKQINISWCYNFIRLLEMYVNWYHISTHTHREMDESILMDSFRRRRLDWNWESGVWKFCFSRAHSTASLCTLIVCRVQLWVTRGCWSPAAWTLCWTRACTPGSWRSCRGGRAAASLRWAAPPFPLHHVSLFFVFSFPCRLYIKRHK